MHPSFRILFVSVLLLTASPLCSEPLLIHKDEFDKDRVGRETTDDNFWDIIELEYDGKNTKALRVTG
mgnify:CR=1 FL=1